MNTIALLFKVLWAPRQTMSRVAQNPRVLAPLLFLTLVTIIEAGVLFVRLDPADLMAQQWQRDGIVDRISQADKDQLIAEKRGPFAAALVVSAMRPLPAVMIVAALFYLCFTFVGRNGDFKSFLAVTAFAFVPTIFRSVAAILSVIVGAPSAARLEQAGTIGPALFLDSSSMSRVAYVGASLVDLISLWVLVLLVIGYGYLVPGRVRPASRVAAVFGMFVLYAVLRLTLAQFGNL